MLDFFRLPLFWGLFAGVLAFMAIAGYCSGSGREFLKGLAVGIVVFASIGCAYAGYRFGLIAAITCGITGVVVGAIVAESMSTPPDNLEDFARILSGSDSDSDSEKVTLAN